MEKQTDRCCAEPIVYPDIGKRVRCRVLRASFAQANLSIIEIEGRPSRIAYRAILKGTGFGEGIYVCDSMKAGDVVDCFVISYGDNAIFVSQ